jgi:hypothetical protein
MIILLLLLQAGDIDRRLQEAPTVRFGKGSVPLEEALKAIPGVRFRVDPKIARDRVTPPEGKSNVFDALHEICRSHGGARILFSTYAPKIQVSPGKAANPPTCNSGPFHFLLTKILASRTHSFDGAPRRQLYLTIWMTWTDTAPPAFLASTPFLSRAEDDRGNSLLLPGAKKGNEIRLLGKPVIAVPSTIPLQHPGKGIHALKFLEGYRLATFIGKRKPVEILLEEGLPRRSQDGRLALLKLARGKGGLTAVLEGRTPGGTIPLADHLLDLQFVDEKGTGYPTRITSAARGPDVSRIEIICPRIPEGASIVSLRTDYVTAWETRRISFSFRNVPLP